MVRFLAWEQLVDVGLRSPHIDRCRVIGRAGGNHDKDIRAIAGAVADIAAFINRNLQEIDDTQKRVNSLETQLREAQANILKVSRMIRQ